jgi:hypothetical protein
MPSKSNFSVGAQFIAPLKGRDESRTYICCLLIARLDMRMFSATVFIPATVLGLLSGPGLFFSGGLF